MEYKKEKSRSPLALALALYSVFEVGGVPYHVFSQAAAVVKLGESGYHERAALLQ